MKLPRIAVTMGDPAGIGPEICLRLLADRSILGTCIPVVFGDAAILRRVSQQLGLPMPTNVLASQQWPTHLTEPGVLNIASLDPNRPACGRGERRGRAGRHSRTSSDPSMRVLPAKSMRSRPGRFTKSAPGGRHILPRSYRNLCRQDTSTTLLHAADVSSNHL